MRKLDRITVGTNFSAAADTAVGSAFALARSFQASVQVAAVVEAPSLYQKVLSPIQSRLVPVEEVIEKVRERIAETLKRLDHSGIQVESCVRVGTPFAELIGAAREFGADLLVAGIRTASPAGRLLLGNTTERLLRKAPLPVLVVKKPTSGNFRRILAPIDFSEAGLPALRAAVSFAQANGAELVLLHVIEPIAETYIWPVEPGLLQMYLAEPEELEEEWQQHLASIDLAKVTWRQETVKGYAPSTIVETAQRIEADLVVLGTHGRTGLAHVLLGSVAESVAREAPCGVLSVRPDAHAFALP